MKTIPRNTSSQRRLCMLALLLVTMAWSACTPHNKDPDQTEAALHVMEQERENLLVLDVRTGVEFGTGHLDGAKNIPVSELDARMNELPKDRSAPILVYCRSGGRSARARKILETAGYTNVTDGGAFESLKP